MLLKNSMLETDSISVIRNALSDAQVSLDALIQNNEMLVRIALAGRLIAECIRNGGHVYACGNGGSLCDAMHFAEEMTGRYRKDRPPYAACALSDTAHMSCVSNDFGFDDVFSRFLAGMGRKGDMLLAISTSGKSKNILSAIDTARQVGMSIIGLTGKADSPMVEKADIAIVTSAGTYADRVQELHIKCIHILIELVERELNPENYAQ